MYLTESYFINVDDGDAAIHIVVNVPDDALGQFTNIGQDEVRPQGWTITNAVLMDGGRTRNSAQLDIRSTIGVIEGLYRIAAPDCLRFDAVAISHWDSDHFEGTMKFLLEEIQHEYDQDPNKCRRFKYNAHDGTEAISTTVFCPSFPSHGKDATIYDFGDENGVEYLYVKFKMNNIKCKTGKLAKACRGPQAIGHDLFTGKGLLPGQTSDKLKSLKDLVDKSAATQIAIGRPLFFCVGISNVFAGEEDVMEEPYDEKDMNGTSMMCIIAWPWASDTKISLYTGGDAEYKQEERLVKWLQVTGTNVECIKAGHHGARTSTPHEMFGLKPTYFIISAALSLVILIMEYLERKKKMLAQEGRIFAMRRPYWFKIGKLTAPKTESEAAEAMAALAKRSISTKDLHLKLIYDIHHPLHPKFQEAFHYITGETLDVSKLFPTAYKWAVASHKAAKKKAEANLTLELQTKLNKLTLAKNKLIKKHQANKQEFKSTLSFYDQEVGGEKDPYWFLAELEAVRDMINRWNEYGKPGPRQLSQAKSRMSYIVLRSCQSLGSHVIMVPDGPGFIAIDARQAVATKWLGMSIKEKTYDPYVPDYDDDEETGKEKAGKMSKRSKKIHKDEPQAGCDIRSRTRASNKIEKKYYEDQEDDEYFNEFHQTKPNNASFLKQQTEFAQQSSFVLSNKTMHADISSISVDEMQDSTRRAPRSRKLQPTESYATFGPLNYLIDDINRAHLSDQELNDWNLDRQDSLTFSWFSNFVQAKDIRVSGLVVRNQLKFLSEIVIQADIAGPASQPVLIEFSTEEKSREEQFGSIGQRVTDSIGFCKATDAWMFALRSCDRLTMDAFTNVIQYPCAPWVQALLGLVPLKPKHSSEVALSRSGIWYQPHLDNITTLRLEMETDFADPAVKPFTDFLKNMLGLTSIPDMSVIGKKTIESYSAEKDNIQLNTTSELYLQKRISWSMNGKEKPFEIDLIVGLHELGLDIIAQFMPGSNPLESLFDWLSSHLETAGWGVLDADLRKGITATLHKIGTSVLLRQVSISFHNQKSLSRFEALFEVPLSFGAPEGKNAALLASIRWASGHIELSGEIWSSFTAVPRIPFEIDPFSESWEVNMKPSCANPIDYLSLKHLIPGHTIENYPNGVPDEITAAGIRVILDQGATIVFSGRVQCDAQSLKSSVPPIWLDSLSLFATYNFKTGAFMVVLEGAVSMRVGELSLAAKPLTTLDVRLEYNSADKSWVVSAVAENVQVANILDFFNKGIERDAITGFIAQLIIPEFSVNYAYENGLPSSFDLKGIIILGPLELDLHYNHGGAHWSFNAVLKKAPAGRDKVTIGELLEDISMDLDDLPGFLLELSIPLDKLSLELRCSKGKKQENYVVFGLDVKVGDSFHLVFSQLKKHKPDAVGEKIKKFGPGPKRSIRLIISKLPHITDIPFLERLEQPFEQMSFLWLNQSLSRAETDVLNTEVFKSDEKLLFKDDRVKTDAKDLVLAAGCHFQLAMKEEGVSKVVIDHVFNGSGNKKETSSADHQPTQTPSVSETGKRKMPVASARATIGDKGSSHAPVKKRAANLSISGMGLKLEHSTLKIILDAQIKLGPIGVSLMRLSLDIDLAKIKTLDDFLEMPFSVSLTGLGVQYSKPPTVIAGLVEKLPDGYAGGLALSFSKWSFMAAGLYRKIQKENLTYPTMFAFVKLEGPLIELEFAEIIGITGGFGYNSSLRFPNVQEVTSFPFVSISSGAQPGPADALTQLTSLIDGSSKEWITPQIDSFWIAAGLGIKAFQVLDVQAVITIDISSEVRVGIFGEALAVQPLGAPEGSEFLVLDIGFAAVLDPSKGIFRVEGQLTPRSFILSSSCHLTGGFALASFFSGSGHVGDWAFSVGGYHPAYKVPSHYPIPQRLGIAWSYDSNISITGEAYFAITPECCMGGGRLDIVYQSDRIRASFNAFADFLINYKPFHYQADVGVAVDVRGTVGWGILSTDVHLEADAIIELYGPPMAGCVHLNLWFISVTVRFGPDKQPVPKVGLEDFLVMVKQAKNRELAKRVPNFILSATKGLIHKNPSAVVKEDDPWVFRNSEFEFEVHTRVPIRFAKCNEKIEDEMKEQRPVYSKPMQLTQSLNSEITISITDKHGNKPIFAQNRILKDVPAALWGAYDEQSDPQKGSTALLSRRAATTVEHVMGVAISSPHASPSDDNIPAFNVHKFNSVDVMSGSDLPRPYLQLGTIGLPSTEVKAASGKDSKEQVANILSIWRATDWKMQRALLEEFCDIMDRAGSTGARTMLGDIEPMAPTRYMERPDEYIPRAPLVC